jgi:hypothetical protein
MKLSIDNKIFALYETVNFLIHAETSADEPGDYEARLALASQLEKRRLKLIDKKLFESPHDASQNLNTNDNKEAL